MAAEDVNLSNLKSRLNQNNEIWMQEMGRRCQVDTLQEKAWGQGSEGDGRKELLDVLLRRLKTTLTLLTFLKSKGRVMSFSGPGQTSCGINELEGVGLINKDGVPLLSWSKDAGSSLRTTDEEDTMFKLTIRKDKCEEKDEAYIGEMLKVVTDIMETLVERVILAEFKISMEKEKVSMGQEEIRKQAVEIDTMSSKLEKMEDFAFGTKAILEDMQQRIDNLVEEIYIQTQRAEENEQELSRVKRDFESMKSYVSSLMSVRETLLSSEKQFHTIKKLFERLVVKTTRLEGEKMHKETQVQKLIEENMRLTTVLDKKEAQLLAMNEQCKVMALDFSNL